MGEEGEEESITSTGNGIDRDPSIRALYICGFVYIST